MERPKTSPHNPWYIALVIYNVITLVVVIVLYSFARFGMPGDNGDLFHTTQTKQYDLFPLDISPAGWTFNLWFVSLAWQCSWLFYLLLNLFRKTPRFHEPLYTSPYLLPPLLLGLYVVANGCIVAWCLLFDREHVELAFAALCLSAILLTIAAAISHTSLDKGWLDLVRQNRESEAWLVRGLVHNGLAVHAAWLFFLTSLHLAIVIAYVKGSDVSVSTSSTVALGFLGLGVGVYAVVDLCVVHTYCRYTVTPYLMVVAGMAGMVVGYDGDLVGERNGILSLVVVGVGVVALVAKVVCMIVRHVRDKDRDGG